MENDIIRLPLAGRPRGIDERRVLAVNRACLPVGIRVVLIGIEDLQLVDPHQEYAAVSALLALALCRRRGPPIDVAPHVAEAAGRHEHACAGFYLDVVVPHSPLRRAAVFATPL